MITSIRIKGVVIFIAALVGLSSLISCQAPASTPAAPTAAPATSGTAQPASQPAAAPTQAPLTVKVGALAPQSGPQAPGGIEKTHAWQLVVDELNAKGGLKVGDKTYRIELIVADDLSTADGARQAADRLLLADKVKFIVGPGQDSGCAGAQPAVEQAKALMMATGCFSVKELLGPKHPTSMTAGAPYSGARWGALANYMVKSNPQLKRVGHLSFDDAAGKAEATDVSQILKDAGLQLVATEYFPMSTTEFGPVVIRLLAQKPDIVELGAATLGASPGIALGIFKALKEQNFKGPLLGGWARKEDVTAGDAAEGFVAPVPMDMDSPVIPAATKDFYNRYVQKFGGKPDFATVSFMASAPTVLFSAIAKAGTVDDTEKIAEVLRTNQWETILGKFGFGGTKTYGAPAVFEAPVFLSQIKGGKFVVIDQMAGPVP